MKTEAPPESNAVRIAKLVHRERILRRETAEAARTASRELKSIRNQIDALLAEGIDQLSFTLSGDENSEG